MMLWLLMTSLVTLCSTVRGQDPLARSCVDVMLVFDTSCSVDEVDLKRGITFVQELIDRLGGLNTSDSNLRVGCITFNIEVEHMFFLSNSAMVNDMKEQVANIKLKPIGCRTYTYDAFSACRYTYFNDTNGDRDNEIFPNIIFFLSDSLTYPPRKEPETIARARELQEDGVEIFCLIVKNNRGKPAQSESVAQIPSNPHSGHIFPFSTDEDKDEALQAVIPMLTTEKYQMCDPQPGFPEQPQADDNALVCADIVFLLDTSCSVLERHKLAYINLMVELVKHVNLARINFGVVLFDRTQRDVIPLKNHDLTALIDDIKDIDTTHVDCKTKTYDALRFIKDEVFNLDDVHDRENTANLLIMAYDGLTAPLADRGKGKQTADAIKDAATNIMLLMMPNNRNKDHIAKVELDDLPSEDHDKYQFNITTSTVNLYKDILVTLVNDFPCVQ